MCIYRYRYRYRCIFAYTSIYIYMYTHTYTYMLENHYPEHLGLKPGNVQDPVNTGKPQHQERELHSP